MGRKPLIAGNWKMYKTPAETQHFVKTFLPLAVGHERDEIALFPSITSLGVVVAAVAGSNVAAGAQNMHFAEEGPFTGETSALQLTAIGATHVLIGHSERRQYFGETDETVNRKLHTALKHRLVPIVCVGEVLAEREAGETDEVLKRQVRGALVGIGEEQAAPVILAYEPVWAIGTGKVATPDIAAYAHEVIRAEVGRCLGFEVAQRMRILYGGSVKPDNCTSLLTCPEIDGALVGGASLNPETFAQIVHY